MTLIPVLNWATEGHGYGPRYLLPLLCIGSLPAIGLVERIRSTAPLPLRAGLAMAFLAALAWSFTMQVYMNSLPYYAYFFVRDEFVPRVTTPDGRQRLERYLHPVHRGLMHRDLVLYRDQGVDPLPLSLALAEAPKDERQELRKILHEQLLQMASPNYLFLALPSAADRQTSPGQTAAGDHPSPTNAAKAHGPSS
jgi:hypothetical protein